jgi:putative ABC transport system permease protein
MPGPHPLLRLAMLFCPREFRRYCERDLLRDAQSSSSAPLRASLNIAATGIHLHAENAWRELQISARVLARAPAFAGIVVLTIALAVGANVTAFSILKGVLLDPLPYPASSRLAAISPTLRGEGQFQIDYPDAQAFARGNRTFSGISAETWAQGALTGAGQPEELHGWYAGAHLFAILRVKPEIGRLLSASDIGKRHVVISDALWRSRFGGRLSVLGKTATIGGHEYTIVGVAPPHLLMPGAGFMEPPDYWLPINPRSANFRGFYEFLAIGRLRPGASWSQAQADLSHIAALLAQRYPHFDAHRGVIVTPLSEALAAPMRTIVVLLFAAAILVFFIAAANVANLAVVRAHAREHEAAVRSALGATRGRVAVHLTVEMALLALAGLAAGIALAFYFIGEITAYLQALTQSFGTHMIIPGWNNVAIDLPVLGYAAAVTILLAIGAPLLAYASQGAEFTGVLAGAGRTPSHHTRRRIRWTLAVCEIVLAFAVLCGAGLLVHSLLRLNASPVGFRESNVYSVGITLPSKYRNSVLAEEFYARALRKLRATPGIAGAGEALVAGLGGHSRTDYSTEHPLTAPTGSDVEFNSISPGFFSTLGIPVLRGRTFRPTDTAQAPPVAIVSRSFAVAHFGGAAAAIGKNVAIGESTSAIGTTAGAFPLRRIVGVVGDVRHSLSDAPSAEVYVPFAQVTFPGALVVRTAGRDPELAREVGDAVSSVDPLIPPPQPVSFAMLRSTDEGATRMAASVLLALAAIALLLALAGVYGVVAYGVQRRTQEFGIRISLGARTSSIATHVLGEAVVMAGVGIALGTMLAGVAAPRLQQLLYQTSPLDALTFACVALFLLAAVSVAALVPALRAARIQPNDALRSG